jgi:regulator of RNase E activity RraA
VNPADDGSGQSLTHKLSGVPTTTAKALLHELGVDRVALQGLRLMAGPSAPFAGPARTLRFLPLREDASRSPEGAVNRRLIDELQPGDVLVIDAMGCTEGAVLGDMLATRARYRGAAGVVADGVVRDLSGIEPLGLPVFALGTHPDPSRLALTPWEADVPIQCGGRLVLPGDYILADVDAVLVMPARLAGEIAARAEETGVVDEFCQRLLAAGFPLDGAYPLPAHLQDDLERYRRSGVVPDLGEVMRRATGGGQHT